MNPTLNTIELTIVHLSVEENSKIQNRRYEKRTGRNFVIMVEGKIKDGDLSLLVYRKHLISTESKNKEIFDLVWYII